MVTTPKTVLLTREDVKTEIIEWFQQTYINDPSLFKEHFAAGQVPKIPGWTSQELTSFYCDNDLGHKYAVSHKADLVLIEVGSYHYETAWDIGNLPPKDKADLETERRVYELGQERQECLAS